MRDGYLVSGNDDGTIKILDIMNGDCKRTLTGHNKPISHLLELSDGFLVSTASNILKIWDLNTGNCIQTMCNENEYQKYTFLATLSDGRFVTTSSNHYAIVIHKFPDVKYKKYLDQAKKYIENGDIKLAIYAFSKAIKKHPEYAEIYYLSARAKRMHGGLHQEAIDDLNEAIRLKPKFKQAKAERLNLKWQIKDHQWILAQCNAVIQSKPEGAKGFFKRAQVKERLEDYEGAIKDYENAIKLKKVDYPEATQGLKEAKEKLKVHEACKRVNETQQREEQEKLRKQQMEDEKQEEFYRQLERLKIAQSNVSIIGLNSLHQQFQALESEAMRLKMQIFM